jgi:hypothetical protein
MRKMLLSLICVVALGFLAGCGNSNHSVAIPPDPSGGNAVGFSNASLSGTYVFAVHGVDNNSNFTNYAVTGTLTADGNGNLTSGTRDKVDDEGRQTFDEAITGSYFVNSDGRGQAILNGPSGRVIYRFVMQSPAVGKLFEDATTSDRVLRDAVGSLQLQTPGFVAPVGTYIVRLDGEDPSLSVYGAIGGIAFTGSNLAGSIDENDSGTFSPMLATSGTLTLSGSRGSATLNISGVAHSLVVYFVSPTQLELLSADRNFFLYGEAEAEDPLHPFATTTSAFATTAPEQVFSLSGFDTNGARVEMGRMTLDSGGTLSNAIEDISTSNFNNSLYSGVSLSGSTYSVGANGRWTATLLNASGAPSPTLVGWQVSPQRSVVLTSDLTILETGTMVAQTLGLNTANVSGNFAETLAGFNSNSQFDIALTGSVNLDGVSALSGDYDEQDDFSGLNLDTSTTGTYAIDPTLGRSSGSLVNIAPFGGSLPVEFYTVDQNTIDFLPSQAGAIYSGKLATQAP